MTNKIRRSTVHVLLVMVVSILMCLQLFPQPFAASADEWAQDKTEELDVDPFFVSTSPLSDRIAGYTIDVALNADKRTLEGQETVTWRNPGRLPVRELYFHLYPNAFLSPRSTFMKEQVQSEGVQEGAFGKMDLTRILLKDGKDLSAKTEFVRPDDDNPDDFTLMKLTLPEQVEPGAAVSLDIRFTVTMPEVRRRMGMTGNFVMAAQWFPKLAVYEPVGMRGRLTEGWNLHQYHANSEFYSDFGTYDVTIHVPPRYQVAATGSLRSAMKSDKERKYRFTGGDIHDFAWAASQTFETAGTSVTMPGGRDVRIKLYMDSKSVPYKNRYLNAAQKAMKRYSEWFGPYPYRTISIVVPPDAAAKAGAMEYPTLITAKSVIGGAVPALSLERTIMHELAHQYWYGMVANNEFEEAWLDESFAVYAEDKAMIAEYGSGRQRDAIGAVHNVVQNSWLFPTRFEYEDNVYFRGKMVLDTIEARIGAGSMNKVMRTYFERFRFQHPSTQDFRTVLEEVTSSDWNRYFLVELFGRKELPSVASDQPQDSVENIGSTTKIAANVDSMTEAPPDAESLGSASVLAASTEYKSASNDTFVAASNDMTGEQ